jgi:hypothetical protein
MMISLLTIGLAQEFKGMMTSACIHCLRNFSTVIPLQCMNHEGSLNRMVKRINESKYQRDRLPIFPKETNSIKCPMFMISTL